MNLGHADAVGLAAEIVRATADLSDDVGVAICPPAVWLDAVAERVRGSEVRLGAQNVHPADGGAFTGEVSAGMLTDLDVEYVIVGHSERRQMGETSAFVAEKVRAAQAAGLAPILCVGETLDERESGDAEATVLAQLAASLADVDSADLVVAYEPVWAIGTGRTATPAQAQAMHAAIRRALGERFEDRLALCTEFHRTRLEVGEDFLKGTVTTVREPGNGGEPSLSERLQRVARCIEACTEAVTSCSHPVDGRWVDPVPRTGYRTVPDPSTGYTATVHNVPGDASIARTSAPRAILTAQAPERQRQAPTRRAGRVRSASGDPGDDATREAIDERADERGNAGAGAAGAARDRTGHRPGRPDQEESVRRRFA